MSGLAAIDVTDRPLHSLHEVSPLLLVGRRTHEIGSEDVGKGDYEPSSFEKDGFGDLTKVGGTDDFDLTDVTPLNRLDL
jgi:hypothetical protein